MARRRSGGEEGGDSSTVGALAAHWSCAKSCQSRRRKQNQRSGEGFEPEGRIWKRERNVPEVRGGPPGRDDAWRALTTSMGRGGGNQVYDGAGRSDGRPEALGSVGGGTEEVREAADSPLLLSALRRQ